MAKYKLVFLGDIYAGKTSVISRFMYDTYDPNYSATIGIDFLSKTMYLDDRTVRLQLWDTAGQERFRSLIPSYIRDSSVAVIVFDVSNKQSFKNTSQWVNDVRSERGTEVLIMLVGNKTDKVEERSVTSEEALAHAKSLDALYAEVSAKTGDNITQLFRQIAQALPGSTAKHTPTPEGGPADIKLSITPPPPERPPQKCRC
jgi:Ras-related protein Rab-6A